MRSSGLRSVVDTGLLDGSAQRPKLLVHLWRALAAGRPLGDAEIRSAIEATDVAPDDALDFLRKVTERDSQGRVTGIMGLSLNDHPHRLTVAGVTLSAWCAVDTLFLPAMLDAAATVESRSPVSGRLIRLEIAPAGIVERAPATVAVSLPLLRAEEIDTSSSATIRSAFCNRIHFFWNEEEAARWITGRGEMEVVSAERAWRHAMETWGKVLSRSRGGTDRQIPR
jgi:alkylmercury lyase